MKPSERIHEIAQGHAYPTGESGLLHYEVTTTDILVYLDEQAKLSESAAGRREPTGADVVGSLLHKWKTEREAEPEGNEPRACFQCGRRATCTLYCCADHFNECVRAGTEPEREAEPGGGEGDGDEFMIGWEYTEARRVLRVFEKDNLLTPNFFEDGERDELLRGAAVALRNTRKAAEERASKAEAELAAAKGRIEELEAELATERRV